jgi:hypothetical protein
MVNLNLCDVKTSRYGATSSLERLTTTMKRHGIIQQHKATAERQQRVSTKKAKIPDNDNDNDIPSNLYTGWTVPSPNYKLPSVSASDLTPRQFYDQYIHQRRPVVLRGLPSDLSALTSWKDIQHLANKVGN